MQMAVVVEAALAVTENGYKSTLSPEEQTEISSLKPSDLWRKLKFVNAFGPTNAQVQSPKTLESSNLKLKR